uniref:Uncharacterized protein n=1 Tax=Cannabis sativa TaxID=3483 RepID=A0A803RB10_CANSA
MDGLQGLGLPILGIVAAAAVTFYVVSFSELREVTALLFHHSFLFYPLLYYTTSSHLGIFTEIFPRLGRFTS